MENTPNLGLRKPEYNETADIADINYNADLIDEAIEQQGQQISDCLDTIGDKAGLLTSVKTTIVGAINSLLTLATTTVNGLMSKEDKNKLNGIAAGANNYIHPSTHPASMITGLPTSLPANGGNADTVDSLHAWQMATLSSTGTSHGTAHVMTAKHNVYGDGKFGLITSQGIEVESADSQKLGGLTLEQVLAKAGDIVGKIYSFEKITITAIRDTYVQVKSYTNAKGGMFKLGFGTSNIPVGITVTIDGVTVINDQHPFDILAAFETSVDGGWAYAGGLLELPFSKSFTIEVKHASSTSLSLMIHYYINQ